jgi:fibronectin type 3 domain-containing protein
LLNGAPSASTDVTTPVQFGKARCFAVAALKTTGAATLEGPLSTPRCITPVDIYPPPAPANLQAIQEGDGVTLTWSGVEAADLGGYVVLRGEGNGADLRPLMRTPIQETSYKDTDVRTGVTYTYSVYAVDTAPSPNVSQQSNRQTVTIR